ncbi:uncharacterized protein TNIN_236741 [Trichonephila inaurata madagascariensis]|uniref:Uncharacterized protein n=1 Tax=Trichonephila inaurata madagascariensis TaxID=2747483 RepID=A0A8X6XQD1_9ARAC|nr:uncharacterized protein TNIN_236741 [Trichonephila inaurata madagascariensis]
MSHSELPFVQGELKHLFKERNKARKLWQFTRHPQHKTELNRLQNTIKRKVNLYRQQVWEDHLTSLEAEDGSLWGTAKAFRRKAAPISALNGPNGTALSDTHKTEWVRDQEDLEGTVVASARFHFSALRQRENYFGGLISSMNSGKV